MPNQNDFLRKNCGDFSDRKVFFREKWPAIRQDTNNQTNRAFPSPRIQARVRKFYFYLPRQHCKIKAPRPFFRSALLKAQSPFPNPPSGRQTQFFQVKFCFSKTQFDPKKQIRFENYCATSRHRPSFDRIFCRCSGKNILSSEEFLIALKV